MYSLKKIGITSKIPVIYIYFFSFNSGLNRVRYSNKYIECFVCMHVYMYVCVCMIAAL